MRRIAKFLSLIIVVSVIVATFGTMVLASDDYATGFWMCGVECSQKYAFQDTDYLKVTLSGYSTFDEDTYFTVAYNGVVVYTSAVFTRHIGSTVYYDADHGEATLINGFLPTGLYTFNFFKANGKFLIGQTKYVINSTQIDTHNPHWVSQSYTEEYSYIGYYRGVSKLQFQVDGLWGKYRYEVLKDGVLVYASEEKRGSGVPVTLYYDVEHANAPLIRNTLPTGNYTFKVYYMNNLIAVDTRRVYNSQDPCEILPFGVTIFESGAGHLCERLYTCCLGRNSEQEGKLYWINSLRTGTTGADAAYAFFFCPEFTSANYSNDEYVRRLYRTFMNREPSWEEYSYWSDLIAIGSITREDAFWGFVSSPEWISICEEYEILPGSAPSVDLITEFATRMYTTCLCRDGEADGINYWSDVLRSGGISGRALAHQFFFSDELVSSGISDQEFVVRLYRTFMGRDGSGDDINYWVSNVEAYGRESVFNGFAESEEFAGLCNQAGINP